MENSPKVIGIGHCTVDVICPLDSFPEIDTKTEITGLAVQGGGPSANAMCAAAKLGLRAALVSRLGVDIFGRFARADLLKRDVECTHLFMDEDARSPLSVVLTESAGGTRTIVVFKGENCTVDPLWLSDGWIMTGDVLHIDGHQLPASMFAAQKFKETGKTVVFDAGSWRTGSEELLSLSDVVIASKIFASRLSENTETAARKLLEYGPKTAVVTLGAEGAAGVCGEVLVHVPGFEIAVSDTTGAGDVFHGAFIYAHLAGMNLKDSLSFSNAAAAIKCAHMGGRGGLPGAAEVRTFLADRKVAGEFGLEPIAKGAAQA